MNAYNKWLEEQNRTSSDVTEHEFNSILALGARKAANMVFGPNIGSPIDAHDAIETAINNGTIYE